MADLFIDGAWRGAVDGRTREIRCPANGSLVGVVDEAGGKDTVAAIDAARRAFDDGPWPRTSPNERGDLLLRVAELLVRDKAALARAESLDTGKRLVESEYDIDDIANCFRYFGGWWRARPDGSSTPGQRVSTAGWCTSRSASAR
ncbi:NAD/NADP-dependent betaine aldehyde dehydrogenase [Streptomyces alboniger]